MRGTEPARSLPAASLIVPLLVSFRPIEPALPAVVPVVDAVTVHVLDGAEPKGVTVEIEGAEPPRPLVTSAKLLVARFLTGSLKVTVQRSGLAFVGFGSVRTTDDSVGAPVSITQVYEAAPLVLPLLSSARTWKVCEPGGSASSGRT